MTAPDSTSPAAPPGVCPRCAGTHAEDDAETGERLPCTVCFGMPLRPAGLDLDAIEALWRRACDLDTPVAVIASWRDVPLLLAEARRLRGLLDAATEAHARLRRTTWRYLGGEGVDAPDADLAVLRRVAEEHKALDGYRRAMLDVCEAIDDVRPEPDFDAPAELGAWACDEIARRVSAARRKGAEAMREACALTAARRAETLDAAAGDDPDLDDPDVAYRYGRFVEAVDLAVALRALPLPGGEP